MGSHPAVGRQRRSLLQAAAAWPLASALGGCGRPDLPPLAGGWVGASVGRGHRLHEALPSATAATPRRASVLIVGAGVAGLAAARGFLRQGVDDVHVLDLEDGPGGNSRSHRIAGMACPLGAHYLPLPGVSAHEVSEWLHEIGLLRSEFGRTVADERHLCHSPQERLFVDGQWHEGLLPPADPASATLRQYRRFAELVSAAPRFVIPTHRAPWTAAHAELDRVPFAAWLDAQGLDDPRLRWYLDYCCRDDYGAGADTVSAWAGLHYFASRHGFHAPGDAEAERDPVFTWPEGNAWLVQRLAAELDGDGAGAAPDSAGQRPGRRDLNEAASGGRMHGGRVVRRVRELRDGVEVLASHGDAVELWRAGTVVLAVPLFVAARLLEQPPDALVAAARALPSAPWLVANLHIDRPLVDRPGAPPSWDNVGYGSRGLGYVDAMHQSLRPRTGPAGATVLTFYASVPVAERPRLLADDWTAWAARVLDDLAGVHPDLRGRVQRIDLMRYGHAMAVPVPGLRSHAGLAALRGGGGRIRFAHADLAGYSIFEEAFTAGLDAARAPCRCG